MTATVRVPARDGRRRVVAPAAYFADLARLAAVVGEHHGRTIEATVTTLAASFRAGGKVLAAGNGGSAADAQHFVGELVGRMTTDRPALPALALTADSTVVTAVANDYGYERVFARQVEALGQPGDVLVVLSTSGRSPNVVAAVGAAVLRGMAVVALTGPDGDDPLGRADHWIRVPSADTAHIQEIHTAVLHYLCLGVEGDLFPRP